MVIIDSLLHYVSSTFCPCVASLTFSGSTSFLLHDLSFQEELREKALCDELDCGKREACFIRTETGEALCVSKKKFKSWYFQILIFPNQAYIFRIILKIMSYQCKHG